MATHHNGSIDCTLAGLLALAGVCGLMLLGLL